MSSWETDESSISESTPDVPAAKTMHSSTSSYLVLNFLGEGCFGITVSSMNLKTKKIVAVKVLKDTKNTEREVNMLKVISELDADLTNIVKFHEEFQHLKQTCLVFERLDISLKDLIKQRNGEHQPLHEIRPVAKQLFEALDALKGLGVLHTDIKSDNVMYVNMKDQPLRVKLIDFGCAMMVSQVKLGMNIQPCGYKAPEVSLGLPFTEAVDMWGVGCLLAHLYLAKHLFNVRCKYQMMKNMVTLLGLPKDHLLRAGTYSKKFFIEEGEVNPSWRLMTAEEFTAVNKVETGKENSFTRRPNSLKGLINIHPQLGAAEMEDRLAFVSLLEGLLHLDGDERFTPRQALEHPFISMSHLRKEVHSRDYRTTCHEAMKVCMTEDSVPAAATAVPALATVFSGGKRKGLRRSRAKAVPAAVTAVPTAATAVPTAATAVHAAATAVPTAATAVHAAATAVPTAATGVTSGAKAFSTATTAVLGATTTAPTAATASSGGKRKWRRLRKFFSCLICCCCLKMED